MFDRPIVEDPPAALEPPDDAAAWLSPPPQPATTSATSAIAAKGSRRDMGFVRVMLVPLVGGRAQIWAPRGMRAPALSAGARVDIGEGGLPPRLRGRAERER